MVDLRNALSEMRRPRLLITAARRGLMHYRPERDLKRILGVETGGEPVAARLLSAEERLEQTRRTRDGTYSIARHIAVLTALLASADGPASA